MFDALTAQTLGELLSDVVADVTLSSGFPASGRQGAMEDRWTAVD